MPEYIFNESRCFSSPDNFEIYESLDVLCAQLEGWYVREEDYIVLDSEGRRVLLHADADHLPVSASIEQKPTHCAQLVQLLRAVIADAYYRKFFELDTDEWKGQELSELFELVRSHLGTYEENEFRMREKSRLRNARIKDGIKRFFGAMKFWKE